MYLSFGLRWLGVRNLYLMNMGKWSDDKSVDIAHSQRYPMSNVARDTSSDVGWVLVLHGVQVGVLGLFSIV